MRNRRLLVLGSIIAGALAMTPALAGNVRISGAGGTFNVPVISMKEARWTTVVRQSLDYSCGSAALATLLTYHYDRPTPEAAVFEALFRAGDQAVIRARGFSMLDMKLYLDSLGFRSDGFRLTLDRLAELGVPGIAMIETKGYRHFVVVKGVDGGEVIVGDPALGVTVYPRATFEAMWNGALLAARENVEVARLHFNHARDWRVRPEAPVGDAVSRDGVAGLQLLMPGFNEFGR